MRKIDEIHYAYDVMDAPFFKPDAHEKQALDLNLIVAKDAPRILGIFKADKKEIFLSQEVEDFYKKSMEEFPNLSMFIKGIGPNKECEKEFDKLNENDKWMFVKTVAYFGDNAERNRFKEVLDASQKINFSPEIKKEIEETFKENSKFRGGVYRFLEMGPYAPREKPSNSMKIR